MLVKIAAVGLAGVLTVLCLPLMFVPGAGGADLAGGVYACGQVGVVLDTIRTLESGGDYEAKARLASASGAYQYIDVTWRRWAEHVGIDTAIYPSAWMAPPIMQDLVASANVRAFLDDHDNDVSLVPVLWYYPAAATDRDLMDVIAMPEAGNVLTPREYQTRWMTTYQQNLADGGEPAQNLDSQCSSTLSADGQWALPAAADILDDAGIDQPHHDYPASDLMMDTGTPIFAITGGQVVRTTRFAANWYDAGCNTDNPPTSCQSCGIGLTIEAPNGLRHTYCHNTTLHVEDGADVTPGQHIADSGNTGRSGAPHLHLELRLNGVQHCPQRLLVALHHNAPTIPTIDSLPTQGCTF